MRLALILLTIADLALALLLIAVSGFVLEGVNNTGPQMLDALYFGAMLLGTIAAPLLAWFLRHRFDPPTTLALAAAPLIVAVGILVVGP